jgi:hypothetical protein
VRFAIVVSGLLVAAFLAVTRPWILPETVADGVCSGNPVGVYRRLANGDDVNAKTPGWSYEGRPIFLYFDNTTCPKPFGDPLLGRILFAFGADVHQETEEGYTLLMLATGERSESNVNLLLAKGVDPNRQTWTGETALMVAARFADMAIIENLLDHRADPNHQNQNGETALMIAAGQGSKAVVESLLRHGADTLLLDQKQLTAVDHAKGQWHGDVVTFLESFPARK